MAAEAIAAGRGAPTYARLDSPIPVGGIGKGIQVAKDRVNIPIGLNYDTEATYSAPELPNSSIPGLLGRKAMKEHRVLLDCFNNKFYTVGPGGYKIQLSPGSQVRDMEESAAGHLMLPCTRYPARLSETQLAFAPEAAASTPQEEPQRLRSRSAVRDRMSAKRAAYAPAVAVTTSAPAPPASE